MGNNPVNQVDPSGEGPLAVVACRAALLAREAQLLNRFLSLGEEVVSLSELVEKARQKQLDLLDDPCASEQLEVLGDIIDRRTEDLNEARKRQAEAGGDLKDFTTDVLVPGLVACKLLIYLPGP